MKKKVNVYDDLMKASDEMFDHAKGKKKLRETKVVNLFSKTELRTLLHSLDVCIYTLESYMLDIGVGKVGRIVLQKKAAKTAKLENKIKDILENFK